MVNYFVVICQILNKKFDFTWNAIKRDHLIPIGLCLTMPGLTGIYYYPVVEL